MKMLQNNIAIIVLGLLAVVLIFFMLRLQGIIVSNQPVAPAPTSETNAGVVQTLALQPTEAVAPTDPPATNTAEPPTAEPPTTEPPTAIPAAAAPTLAGYKAYGALIIGAIHVGAINDRGYNQAHHDGLQQMIAQVSGVRLIEIENVPETEAVSDAIDKLVQEGAQIIFAQSFGYLPYALAAAERYPQVVFMHPGGFELRDNLGTYWANNFEAMYLAGIAAGANSKTGKLGFITAFPIPNILASVNAFHLGARSINPAATTTLVINGAWVDPAKEAVATNALANAGVDVVTMIIDSPITVVKTAEERGIFVIGFHSAALQEFAPQGWLTGVDYSWGNYYSQAIEEVRAGQWKAAHVRGGIESDMIQLAPFGPAVSEEIRARIGDARTDLISSRRQIFQGPIRDNLGIERIKTGQVGGLELLDTTDWLVEGVTQFDVAAMANAAAAPTATPASAAPTAEPVAPTVAPTVASAEAPATPTETAPLPTTELPASEASTPAADLILGTIKGNAECDFFSKVAQQMVEQELDLTVTISELDTSDLLYEALANRQTQRVIDISLCFNDPDDRSYLRKHFGFLKQIGEVYWQNANMGLQVVSNGSLVARLEDDQPCVYALFRNLQFDSSELPASDPGQWVTDNAETVRSWAACEILP